METRSSPQPLGQNEWIMSDTQPTKEPKYGTDSICHLITPLRSEP